MYLSKGFTDVSTSENGTTQSNWMLPEIENGKRSFNSQQRYHICPSTAMKLCTSSCLVCLILCHLGEALQQPSSASTSSRRAFFKSTISTGVAFTSVAAPVLAEEAAKPPPAPATEKKDAAPAVATSKPPDAPKKDEKTAVAEAKPPAPKKDEKTAVADGKPAAPKEDAKKVDTGVVAEAKPKPAEAPKKEEKAASQSTTLADAKPAAAPAPKPAAEAPKKEVAAAKKDDRSSFAGSYTDPNHPGGKTTIRLTGQKVGDYVLAEVVGGGGKNEPANYTLPAVLMGERTIFIDFTSKGGPRNFVGFLNKDGDIDFLKDGNRWSRI